ncbi:hypothetical protein AAFF_G00287440 [Aldrovandia affinis]|uniref:Uncharacterized protein n=1 Tax=Aldrovandia affinis TaxID=143900 RepID=A0AAD7WS68_9TELE|nr:hypothetical protein AAFF_G00287440 [Aldrovandia affinis]
MFCHDSLLRRATGPAGRLSEAEATFIPPHACGSTGRGKTTVSLCYKPVPTPQLHVSKLYPPRARPRGVSAWNIPPLIKSEKRRKLIINTAVVFKDMTMQK